MRHYTGPAGTPDVRGLVNILRDVAAADAAPEDIHQTVEYDELTELPNRKSFHEHVQRAIGTSRRNARNRFAVLLVDLDSFAAVNHKFGFALGDKLLAVAARRLELCVGSTDIVARVEAHAFAILLNDMNAAGDADVAAERIAMLMHQPAIIDDRIVRTTVSTGIAVALPEYRRPQELLRDAGVAMHAARDAGGGGTIHFGRLPPELQTARQRVSNERPAGENDGAASRKMKRGHGAPLGTGWKARPRFKDEAPAVAASARPVPVR